MKRIEKNDRSAKIKLVVFIRFLIRQSKKSLP